MIALTRRDRICLSNRVLAGWLEDQITTLLAHVVGVEAGLTRTRLSWIEMKANVEVSICLGSLQVDGSCQIDAGGQQLEAVGAVDVGVGIADADWLDDGEARWRHLGGRAGRARSASGQAEADQDGHAHQSEARALHLRHSVLSGMGSPELANAIADVADGFYLLCHVALIAHDGASVLPVRQVLLSTGGCQ